jgi:predicted metal-dependent hydrolase
MSEARTITLDGRDLVYQLKRSRRRTIGFAISHDGLAITAPMRLSQREIDRALASKSAWVWTKLDTWAQKPAPQAFKFLTGEALPWLGGTIPLQVEDGKVRTLVSERDGVIRVSVDPHVGHTLRTRAIRAGLIRYYKRVGLKLMAPKVDAYAATLGRDVRKVLICDQKSRWGSCAADGTVRLNWRLMGFPEDCIDYVCAHEAAHLVEPNHSAAYWAVVETLIPDWKDRRKRMRDAAGLWAGF